MDSLAIRQALSRILECEPRSFAEAHYRLQRAKVTGDLRQHAGLELYLANLFTDVNSPSQASKHLAIARELLESAPFSGFLDELTKQIAAKIAKPEARMEQTLERLSALEKKLVEWVRSGPKDKFEVIRHLYGEDVDVLVCENRLKNILFRVRAKFPGLIRYEDGRYVLNA